MLVKILKPFPFSRDGLTVEQATVSGDPEHRHDIPDGLCDGLAAEGYIGAGEPGARLAETRPAAGDPAAAPAAVAPEATPAAKPRRSKATS